uniref:Nudix hydrolase domain-containing protein n=1 Tax=Phenylobacterium glaciei TaxID=2803784 RepID=A0A974P810_9CAUL|nr:hypothetical protein JKL49_23905 [Phenylobacterium glaciei]
MAGATRSDFDLSGHYGAQPDELTPASVLVGLVEREGAYSVILTRRADTLRRHTGQIALPGGRRDPGRRPGARPCARPTRRWACTPTTSPWSGSLRPTSRVRGS